MKKYATLIFDLDGTLAVSKSAISNSISELLSTASKSLNLVIISGGMFSQIKKQVIDELGTGTRLENISILPTSGSQMLCYNVKTLSWDTIYKKVLSSEQKNRIVQCLKKSLGQTSFSIRPQEIMGEQIEDRDSQISFSALGQDQLADIKSLWDPSEDKRREMMTFLTELDADFDVKLGGSTSIDITLKGIDKEFGINEYLKVTHLAIEEALFVGDKITPGGNDFAATKTGIDTYHTKNPEDTAELITRILNLDKEL